MIDYINKDLFEQDSINKQFIIEVDDGQRIDNTVLYENSFTLEESICESETIKFGGCNASSIKFRIRNTVLSLIGKTLVVKIIINGDTAHPFYLGTYKVEEDVYTEGRLYRDVTAYDRLYELCNKDITDWYKSLSFPIRMDNMFNNFCARYNIQKTFDSMPMDSMLVKEKKVQNLDSRTFLQDYFEINGAFGYITRGNKLGVVTLNNSRGIVKTYKRLQSVQYEDYFSEPIIKVTLIDGENTGEYMLDDGNEYIISNNLFLYGKTSDELDGVARALLGVIGNGKYKIMTNLTVKGNPCLEVGDRIWVEDGSVRFDTFVLQRTLTGIQAMRDVIKADGTQYQENVARRKTPTEQTKANTDAISRLNRTSLHIVECHSEEEVGTDPYTIYFIPK